MARAKRFLHAVVASDTPAKAGLVPAISITASQLLTTQSQYGSFIVAPAGSGKHYYVLQAILDQLRLGKTVVVVDRGRSYFKLAEQVGGTYYTLDDKGNQEKVCRFGSVPLVVYDFDSMPVNGQLSPVSELPDLPPELWTKEGFLVFDEVWAVERCYSGAVKLLMAVASAGGSYCVVGQCDEDVKAYVRVAVPFIITVRLKSGSPCA